MKSWVRTPKTIGVSRFSVLTWLGGRCGARAKGRGRRGDFSMVRIRLARFALPRLGLGGSKSGVSCSPLVCRVRGTIENVRASAARPEAVSIALRDHRLPEITNILKRFNCCILENVVIIKEYFIILDFLAYYMLYIV